jgi:hypothetical protein
VFDNRLPAVVVDNSHGRAVAININSGNAKLVLLCPAWKKWGTTRTVRPDSVNPHGRADDVLPFLGSEELANKSGAKLLKVGSDHRLADPDPQAAILRACKGIDHE